MGHDFSYTVGRESDSSSSGDEEEIYCGRHNWFIGHMEGVFYDRDGLIDLIDMGVQKLRSISYTSDEIDDIVESILVFSQVLRQSGDDGATMHYC